MEEEEEEKEGVEEEEEEGKREICRGYDCEVLFPGRAAVAARQREGECVT